MKYMKKSGATCCCDNSSATCNSKIESDNCALNYFNVRR